MQRVLIAWPVDKVGDHLLKWLEDMVSGLREMPKLLFLHVVPVETQGMQGVTGAVAEGDLNEVHSAFEKIRGRFPESVEFQMIAGLPGPTICEVAKDYDMVVVGTHRRSALSQLMLGSVGSFVTHNSPVPVVVVR